jgi:phosphoribosylpyrophosphate synthetase
MRTRAGATSSSCSPLFPANDQLIELTFWMDALKRASAASVTAVIPYFNYAKGDRLDQPQTSIRARVCADMIQNAGADAVIMLDLRSRASSRDRPTSCTPSVSSATPSDSGHRPT